MQKIFLKYSNFLVFLLCVGVFFAFFDKDKISTNILDLFPKVEERELIDIHLELASQNSLLVAIGETSASRPLSVDLGEFDAAIDSKSYLTPNSPKNHRNSPQNLGSLDLDNSHKLAESSESKISSLRVSEATEAIQRDSSESKNLITHPLTPSAREGKILECGALPQPPLTFCDAKSKQKDLDLGDSRESHESPKILAPLAQFSPSTQSTLQRLAKIPSAANIIYLKDNIFMLHFDKSANIEDFYSEFLEATKDAQNLRYFSSDILRIENSNAIFSDVNVIMASSISFLVIMYLFILRIPFLSLNTLLTIVSANLLGITALTRIYDNVNIMALEFGVAIGNLAIDYMLHHHFFRHYMHHFKFNKSVFYGFITSFIGFGICLFIPFPLLSQLSFYAMICLLISYISFGILYQFIGFKKPIFYRKLRRFRRPKVASKVIALLAIFALGVSALNFELDYDLERLDYQNKARLADKTYFTSALGENIEILIKGDSLESLHENALKVARIASIKSDITNLNVIERNGIFYSAISVGDAKSLQYLDFVESRSIEELSNEITSGIYKPMLVILAIVISSMIVIVLLITRALASFVYIIAPLAAIFLYFLSIKVNIMHLFSLLIVVVSSIDYGIYVQKEGENIKTLHAIIFSALTTIAGFGFLAFSKILALKSFGITIIIGLFVILLLLLFQRRHKKSTGSI